jgi:hypothetical protein
MRARWVALLPLTTGPTTSPLASVFGRDGLCWPVSEPMDAHGRTSVSANTWYGSSGASRARGPIAALKDPEWLIPFLSCLQCVPDYRGTTTARTGLPVKGMPGVLRRVDAAADTSLFV